MIFAHSPFVAVLAATLLSVQFAFSQEIPLTRFVVIDEQTLKPIPFVSISLLRANLYINTEDDGIFSIPGELPKIKDTLRVSAQNYATLLIPLGKLSAQNSIRLKPVPYKPNKAKRTLAKDSVLNDFSRRDITHYADIQKTPADADHLQLAQQFDLPFAGALLQEVTIHRLAFTFHHNGGIESTRFHLRVYRLDKNTGGPGKDLCGRIIEIKNRESKRIRVNLQDDNIAIPDSTFRPP
ncbi:carboxypeptidase-like regulatory domain-containing protein [Pedobacter deserti]|uniref:carboxypeptidase-like regulatory domain-containing protein n=1 Tax=Pedobacter deserti TaxID=2817382 RepID=UPI00210EFA88|nr:carboxypeptidase-like regulatory domain-containing protein [Pedobacter sp. SYSU D00382]